MSRPRGNHRARRDDIALGAAAVISERGLEQITLRDIAASLGVTTGVITHYFPSKQALLRHTKNLAFDRSFARARAAAEGPPGIARVYAVVEAVLPLDQERRTLWRLLVAFFGSAVGSAALRRAQEQRMGRWYDLFTQVVAALHATGELSPSADPARVGKAIALFVEGLAIHVVMTAPGTSAEWQREFACENVRRLVAG
ncbi:MAG: TetR family transcriptional regulator [Cytophagaceae bacterium]|nr:TetR family transcriptional regulator [Gemmatimonadaceae bacterium]